MRWFLVAVVSIWAGLITAPGCDDVGGDADADADVDGDGDGDADADADADSDADGLSESFLDGTLGAQYDLSFDTATARQFVASRQLLIEYVRGHGEKPLIVTIRNPGGPGSFDYDAHEVGFGNTLPEGSPSFPDVVSATVDLEVYTPGEVGSDVQGHFDAVLFNTVTRETFTLEGAFSTSLEVVP